MNKQQYEAWKDFALRMARTCFNHSRRPGRDWIIEQVEDWFWWRDYQKDWGDYNSWDQDRHPLCDHISEFYDNAYPDSTCNVCRHYWDCREHNCEKCRRECRCYEVQTLISDQFYEQWLGPVHCCLRAGIDMVCEPSAGVLGFTAGDLRRMYPEGVPDFIKHPKEGWTSGPFGGERKVESKPFDEWDDSVAVLL